MTQYIQKLPAVFQTVTEKKFFDATIDQVFSKKDSDYLAGYIGRRDPGSYNPIKDFYLPEPSKDRTWWQLEATAYAEDASSNKTNIFFYDDLLDRINYYGGSTLNQDRLFESAYYSFGPPIDYDMFINYQNYYWVEQGLSPITITGVTSSQIIGQASYTTPPTATPPNLKLTTGMTIILTDDLAYITPHVVENFGGCDGIGLVPQFPDYTAGTVFEFLPWDGTFELSTGRIIQNTNWDTTTWEVETQPGNGDYITIERGSLDRNAWSRTNKWFHIDTINATINATGTGFPGNATRALRPIIQFVANLFLYNSGTQFRDSISYGFRDDSFGNPLLLSEFQFQQVAVLNAAYGTSIVTGTLVAFFNDTTPLVDDFIDWDTSAWDTSLWDAGTPEVINKYIFTATVNPDGTVFFYPKTDYNTPVVDGDIVFITEDAPFDGALRGQTWYYNGTIWQEAFNDKITTNQPPLFQLYDHNGIELDDPTTYPESTFEGSKIFSYKVNATPGATSDPVLGFPIVYTSLGQATDIVFQNNLITDRYTYGTTSSNIDGYYYYKTAISPILYNNWNLYNICDCSSIVPPPPVNCLEVSKQRVIDKFVVGFGTLYQFKLSVIPYGYPASPDIIVSVNATEILPYDATTNPLGYTFTTINNSLYVDMTAYLTSLLTTTQTVAPVVETQTYTHGLLDPAAPGYFEIPQQLEANPNQEEIGEISGSNLIQQFTSIIANQIGFTGSSFGGSNNYRDSRKNRSVGSYILQNLAPLLKTMLVSSSDDLDFIAGERFSSDEYTKFKNRYLSVALQLINQEFNPVQYHNNTIAVSAWVGQILATINISKEFSNAFAYSYMAASGTPFASETQTVPGNSLVTLTNYIDLTDPKNVLYIYNVATSEMLVVGRDYTISSTNLAIDVQLTMSATPIDLLFYLYKDPLPTYIPSTPSKLGMYPTYIPRIELDTSYAIPTNVIIGHDGSKTIAYGDYRDQLLLELENRIYNGIQEKFRTEYFVPLRDESIRTGFFRKTRYTRQEYLDITESYINKWTAKNRANYHVNDWPTASVQPGITPSFVPGVGNIWKLYNYRNAVNVSAQPLNLPGNWKGIFEYYYDTIYPNTRPWEMLGFSSQPSWWVAQYGAGVIDLAGQTAWPNTPAYALMWADLENGIIRQGPSAIYDPITLLPLEQYDWARPGLSTIIPVNAAGEIIPVPTLFGIAFSGNYYEPYDHFDEDWIYGDGSPVESAWMSTSAYAYSTQEFLYLMCPGPFGELLFDALGTELSPGQLTVPTIESPVISAINWQYVQNDLYTSTDPFFAWMRPKNADQIVHAEIVDGVTQVRFGYQVWISDRILFLNKVVADTFGQKVRTLDVNLANKLAGFTNKDTTNTYIESVTPGATTNTLIIPSTNFDVVLHTSPPIAKYAYSGVIIRALADGTFVVYGYDLLNSEFTTFDRTTDQVFDITVGGTPAAFEYFAVGGTYAQGEIVRYNGVYYQSLATQTVSTFASGEWVKLGGLPTVGGITVEYKPIPSANITTYAYGSIFPTVQAVFDMLIGWGDWLQSQGWVFDDVSSDNQVSDWLYSAKQYLFWLNTNWAPDASIQLSPLANSATLVVARGYPDDVESLTNGVYSILDKYGIAISPQNTTVDRAGTSITVSPANLSAGGIYFLQVTASETEHILIFDNTTNFNDIVYDPLLRARQQRLRFNGFRSNGWYGKMEAPGYLIIANELVPNYDTIVESMRYFYDPNQLIDNPSLEDLGRHLIGYESKSYLDNLQVSNNTQYLFYQGAIRQKGTSQAFEKLFRSTKIQSNEVIEVFEEWALKLGDFGNTIEQVSTEFILKPEQNSGEVIVARLNFVPSKIGFVKEINILNAQNVYTTVPSVVIAPPDASPTDPDLTGPLVQATAYIVLDASGRISRVDVLNPGYGYLEAPYIQVSSGAQPHELDKLYSVWQGQIIKDTTLDNIVNIDIDQTDVWTVRPPDPAYSLEFPVTDNIVYPTPNAGYVNFNDVDYSSFNADQTVVAWGASTALNPIANDTLWIADTFTTDWDVYKMVDVSVASAFQVVPDSDNNLQLKTQLSFLVTPQFSATGNTTDFGNLVQFYVREARASVDPALGITAGAITDITLDKTGANYISVPVVTITGTGTGATAVATIAGGVVTGFTITNGGTGYTSATITIAPPAVIAGATNYALAFALNQIQTDSAADGFWYYDILTNDGNPVTITDAPEYLNFTNFLLFKTMRFMDEPAINTPSYVSLGDKIWVDGSNLTPPLWTVYTVIAPTTKYPTGHQPYRVQEPVINTKLFQSASVFNTTGTELVQLPIFDPFKDILPGPAKQNISYMSLQDPARYNVTGDTYLFSENVVFGPQQVGKLWWDLSTARYVYYEQPIGADETPVHNLTYRRDNWGKLFPGSSIDVYEWVQSPVAPVDYTGSGTPKDVTTYVQITSSNGFTNATETNYYFWVLGATDQPNIENRTLAALDVAQLLQSPKSQGFAFFCPIQQTETNNSYMFYNVQEILAYQGDNVQIQYRVAERDDQEHTQWAFFREGDTNSLVTDQFWNKMVDSLCGYTKVLPVSGEFANAIIVADDLPWDIYGWDISPFDDATSSTTPQYGEILPVPDPQLSAEEAYGVLYRPRQGMFVNLAMARKIFVQAANALLQYIPIRDTTPSWNVGVQTGVYWKYTNWYAVGYENVTPIAVFPTLASANTALTAGQLQKGMIVQVTNGTIDGRYVLYAVVQLNANIAALSLNQVAIQDSAIELLPTIYTVTNVYGLSVELRQLLAAFRTEVMIDAFIVDQNELFFSMLNFVVSEQKTPDWVFKSSYIYIKENNLPLSQDQLYVPDQIDNIISYIIDAKPYHTQIRDYTSTYVTQDIAIGTASDAYEFAIRLQFGPDFGGPVLPAPIVTLDAMIGFDLDQGQFTEPWDSSTSADLSHEWDPALNIANVLAQFVSQEDVYTVPLTFFDTSKVGLSDLFPYTFNFNSINLNGPQSFISPANIVGVQYILPSGAIQTLNAGQDFYVEYNTSDATYTAYFYADPSAYASLTALVWFDGGQISRINESASNIETINIFPTVDDFVVNVDTQLPVNIGTGSPTPYVGWGDVWDVIGDPVASILVAAGGAAEIPWDAPTTLELLPDTISFKENSNRYNGAHFYRNNASDSGTLSIALPAPTLPTYNLDVITVFVDPATHPSGTDVLPDPGVQPGAIWINGERIEYKHKQLSAANTWELKLVARGTRGTSAVDHAVGAIVFVEKDNLMPANSNVDVWNAYDSTPANGGTDVTYVPIGGLWYSMTSEAVYLKDAQGVSIP